MAKLARALLETEATGDTVELPYRVGEAWFFRTVTYHHTGRIRAVVGKFLVLDDCAWIANDGRFMQALRDGTLDEVEPMPDGSVLNTDSIVDSSPWNHPLPRAQK